jgi:hypothetical protein
MSDIVREHSALTHEEVLHQNRTEVRIYLNNQQQLLFGI